MLWRRGGNTNEKPVECFGSLCNRLGLFFNCLPFGMVSNRRWLVECAGMCFMGVCRLLGWLILLLTITIVGSLWNGSVCVLWVCVGCLGGCFYCLFDGFDPFCFILCSILFSFSATPTNTVPNESMSTKTLVNIIP